MKKLKIISVGRLKTPFWQDAAEHYRDRLRKSCKLEEVEVKDSDAPQIELRNAQEGQRLLQAVRPSDYLFVLDEHGGGMTSETLAHLLSSLEDKGFTPCFIIGGAYGLAPVVREKAARIISLGPLTLPHELARVVLLEQLFRADAIVRGTGYHH